MRNTKRERNRWLTALAVTCLSGVALCGCARETRDVSTNLRDSAAREAIEAERNLADRKKKPEAAPKTRELAANDAVGPKPRRRVSEAESAIVKAKPKTKSKTGLDFEETNVDSAELALRPLAKSKKPVPPRAKPDHGLETAEWASEGRNQRVQTVSDEKEVDVAESLMDGPKDKEIAEDLFDDKKTVTQKRAAEKPSSRSKMERPAEPLRAKPSYDGASAHPWAEKAPRVAHENGTSPFHSNDAESSLVRKPFADPEQELEAVDDVTDGTASLKLEKKRLEEPQGEHEEEDPVALEAKARVRVLLSQAKSFIRKEDYRSAYRSAQMAQRVAESENLFFAGGEEQPADVVRTVLMKIRFEEHTQATAKRDYSSDDVTNAMVAEGHDRSPEVDESETGKNISSSWREEEWKGDLRQTPEEETWISSNTATRGNRTGRESPFQEKIKIKPGPTSQKHHAPVVFPETRQEWQGSVNEPLALSSSSETEDSVNGQKVPGELPHLKVVQADLHSPLSSDAQEETAREWPGRAASPFPTGNSDHTGPAAPLPPVAEADSRELALSDSWRSQDLTDVASTRSPLLVAPLPPAEPQPPTALATEVLDHSIGVDIEEPVPQPPESKLWIILSAAAGAFAMLFVRRRPPVVQRTTTVNR